MPFSKVNALKIVLKHVSYKYDFRSSLIINRRLCIFQISLEDILHMKTILLNSKDIQLGTESGRFLVPDRKNVVYTFSKPWSLAENDPKNQ